MHPIRLSGRRLYVPGYGILPYIRGLQLVNRMSINWFSFRIRLKDGGLRYYAVRNADYVTPLIKALEALEVEYGQLQTARNLRTKESVNKKNPTGYVGVFVTGGRSLYRITCPYETNELNNSLLRAIEIRRQASEEYLRKSRFPLKEILAKRDWAK